MEEEVQFTLDFLAEDGEGSLSYYPSSPENEYLWQGKKLAVTKRQYNGTVHCAGST